MIPLTIRVCVCVRVHMHTCVLGHSVMSDFLRPPMDCSPRGSSVHGILQAIILEWAAISFSMGSSRPRNQNRVSCSSSSCTGRQILYCPYSILKKIIIIANLQLCSQYRRNPKAFARRTMEGLYHRRGSRASQGPAWEERSGWEHLCAFPDGWSTHSKEVFGETLTKRPTLARHHSNYLHELF